MQSNVNHRAKPLIIGYGNPLRGDDAFGQFIVVQLRKKLDTSLVTILSCQQLTIDIAQDITGASRVILIDASARGVPGTLKVRAVGPSNTVSPTLEHHVTPTAVVAAVDALYGNPPPTYLVSVVGKHWETSETLSEPVKASVPEAINAVIKLLAHVAIFQNG